MRFRLLSALIAAGVFLALNVAVAGAQSQPGNQDAAQTFTLAPGASATIEFEGFCYQFGEAFPGTVQGIGGLADDNVRAALSYAQSQNLTGSDQDALEVQYAIWQLQGEADAPQGGQIAQDVVNNANTPPQDPQGTSLVEAAQNGQVTITIDEFEAVGDPVEISPGVTDNFYGRGTLTVTNSSQESLDLYMPVGTIIASTNTAEQDLVAYATNLTADQPAQAQTTPTTQPTQQATAQATATTQPTQQATAQATAATQPTQQATAQATTTAQPTQQPTQLPQTSGSSPLASLPLLIGAALLVSGIIVRMARK